MRFTFTFLVRLECFKTDLQKIIGMLKCKKDKEKLLKYIRRNEEFSVVGWGSCL